MARQLHPLPRRMKLGRRRRVGRDLGIHS
jgi:hypothetical protein